MKHIDRKVILSAVALLVLSMSEVKAQYFPVPVPYGYGYGYYYSGPVPCSSESSLSEKVYVNIDWQLNASMCNGIAETFSGWGASLESGYFVTGRITVGGFLGYHTNNEYYPRQVFYSGDGAVSTDQQHSLFQLPFGVSARYYFMNGGIIHTYAGVRTGAEYSFGESYAGGLYTFRNTDWGFYVSPEVGMELKPFNASRFGFRLAVYYSYATNDNSLLWYEASGLNNAGMRVGIAF